jgi:hypothetical protein
VRPARPALYYVSRAGRGAGGVTACEESGLAAKGKSQPLTALSGAFPVVGGATRPPLVSPLWHEFVGARNVE